MDEKIKHYLKVIFACLGAGMGSSILLMLVAMLFVGLNDASNLIFSYQTLIILAFGAIWFPYINKHLK